MTKTDFVLEKIKAVKGNVKAKNDRLKFYSENSNRIEKLTWDYLTEYDFEAEIVKLTKTKKTFEQLTNPKI